MSAEPSSIAFPGWPIYIEVSTSLCFQMLDRGTDCTETVAILREICPMHAWALNLLMTAVRLAAGSQGGKKLCAYFEGERQRGKASSLQGDVVAKQPFVLHQMQLAVSKVSSELWMTSE